MKFIYLLIAGSILFGSQTAAADDAAMDDPMAVKDITAPANIARITLFLERDLQRNNIPAHVSNCVGMIDITVPVRDGNNSYGAVCDITISGKTKKFLICNDEMVGHLAISADAISARDWVEHFTHNNCYGG
jgi:hypothetical protein